MTEANRDGGGDLPPEVGRVLEGFLTAARAALGDDLRSAVLFGSAAEGRLRATSDVNLMLVLASFDPARVDRLTDPLALATAAVRLKVMFVLEAELAAVARTFAAKFADMKRRHRTVYGSDPLVALELPRDAVIRRLKQSLRNLILRLREAYVRHGAYEEQLARVCADAAGPLRAAATSLLELEGAAVPTPREALRQLALSADPAGAQMLVAHLSQARERGLLPPGMAKPVLLSLIALAQAILLRVEAVE